MRNIAKKYFKDGSHGWDHTERVYNLCMHIGKIEAADLDVLKHASLLHDIARQKEDEHKGGLCHAELGAKMAGDIFDTTMDFLVILPISLGENHVF